jgi:polyferredoxin
MPLCPHWYGVTEGADCADPLGGERRLWTVFLALIILLPVSRVLSRRLRGRRISERMARQKAHSVIRAVSLMVLGIAVQGCYCPLGAFQYLFVPGGLAFLGILGVVILVLPIIQAMVCGRVFCAWVCPMGGLQEFLYRIHVPGQFSPKGKIHRLLLWLKYVILVALVAGLLLVPSARAGRWEAFFCRYDPFHTVFMLFVSGSLIWAGVMILLSMFIRRFFCKYLCFYGALLSIFNRARLLQRFKKRPSRAVEVAEIDSDEEFER